MRLSWTIIGCLVAIMRRWPATRRMKLEGIIHRLSSFSPGRWEWHRVGPMNLRLDIRDRLQREMLMDTYEPLLTRVLAHVLREGDTYVDIGAQVGYTAALAAERIGPRGRMVLIEPDPTALERLRGHVDQADSASMPYTDIVDAACSDRTGELFFEQAGILGHSRILLDESELRNGRLTRVPLVLGDDVVVAHQLDSIRVLKIDVEGHEHHVLAGLQETLRQQRADVIVIEKNLWLFDQRGEDAAILHALIARHGYVGFHETSRRPITSESIRDNGEMLENLFYCRDAAILAPFVEGDLARDTSGFTSRELEMLALVVIEPESPAAKAHEAIERVRHGHLAEGIVQGEELLAEYPDLDILRGHVAYWHRAVGDSARAVHHYRILLERDPDDREARSILNSLES